MMYAFNLPSDLWVGMKRREAKSKGEKKRYKNLNAEFQKIARRDKKAFFSDQCKEIKENHTGVGCHALLQGIFLTQGSNPCLLGLLHCRWIL